MLDYVHEIDGSGKSSLYLPAGGSLHPSTAETVANHMHYVHQDGQAVYKFAVRKMAEVTQKVLDRSGITAAELGCFIPHQANKRIIVSTAERLGLPMDRVVVTSISTGIRPARPCRWPCTRHESAACSRRAAWCCWPASARALPWVRRYLGGSCRASDPQWCQPSAEHPVIRGVGGGTVPQAATSAARSVVRYFQKPKAIAATSRPRKVHRITLDQSAR